MQWRRPSRHGREIGEGQVRVWDCGVDGWSFEALDRTAYEPCYEYASMPLFGRDRGPDRVAVLVDGPNVLRDEFDVDLAAVREAAEAHGQLAVTRCYLDDRASSGLIQAAEARGFEVRITSGDVDVKLAVDGAAIVCDGDADVLAIASRDTDFKPLVELATERGLRTLAIAPGSHGRSDGLRNAATDAVTLGE